MLEVSEQSTRDRTASGCAVPVALMIVGSLDRIPARTNWLSGAKCVENAFGDSLLETFGGPRVPPPELPCVDL